MIPESDVPTIYLVLYIVIFGIIISEIGIWLFLVTNELVEHEYQVARELAREKNLL